MAYTGLATYDIPTQIGEDVSDIVFRYAETETPFLDKIGMGMRPATNRTHEWLTSDVRPASDALNEALDGSETAVDVDNGAYFSANQIIMVDDELMLVTSISTNTLTVVRGYGSSSAATHTDNKPVYIVSAAAEEGDDAPANRSRTRTRAANYTQIINSDTVDVSGTTRAVNTIGIADEFEEQRELSTLEAMRDLERASIYSSQHSSTPAGGDDVPRTMQGLWWWPSTNAFDASSATLTEPLFFDYLRQAWKSGMKSADFMLVGSYNDYLISRFDRTITQVPAGNNSIELGKRFIRTKYSDRPIEVILSRWMNEDEILIGDSRRCKSVNLAGRSFGFINLAKTGDSDRGYTLGEYTLEVMSEKAFMKIYNTATS